MLHLYYTDVLPLISNRYRNTKRAKPFSSWLLLQSSPPRGPGYASVGWHLRGCCSQQKQPPEVFCKKVVLRNFAKFTGNQLCQNLFFNRPEACNFIEKETLAQVFSCEFCEFFQNTFSWGTPLVAASESRFECKQTILITHFAELLQVCTCFTWYSSS